MMSAVRHCFPIPSPPSMSMAAVWIAMATEEEGRGGVRAASPGEDAVTGRVCGQLTGPRPQGVDGDLTPELLGHAQDAHGHAVLRHRVRCKQGGGG